MKWFLAKMAYFTIALACTLIAMALFSFCWFMDWCCRSLSRK